MPYNCKPSKGFFHPHRLVSRSLNYLKLFEENESGQVAGERQAFVQKLWKSCDRSSRLFFSRNGKEGTCSPLSTPPHIKSSIEAWEKGPTTSQDRRKSGEEVQGAYNVDNGDGW